MPDKVTVASDWLGGCAGCHMSLLDIDHTLLALLDRLSLTATPITDLKHPPAGGVDVGILEGAITNTANQETALRMRQRCKCLIALGDCAVFGGVPTLCNAACQKAALERAYMQSESTVGGHIPDDPELATILPCRPVNELVAVDVYLPGCPPSPESIAFVLKELLDGRKPDLKGRHLHWH